MDNFFTKEILTKLRNRSYFESFTEDGAVIQSEGAWRMTFSNEGTTQAFLVDGAGNRKHIPGDPGGGFPLSQFYFILDGAPYLVRDDELTVEFEGAGDNLLVVVFDRVVTKKEDSDYPVDTLMDKQK